MFYYLSHIDPSRCHAGHSPSNCDSLGIPGVAHRTAEKQRPGPLDLALLFQEVVKHKKLSGSTSSTREILFASIAEYNKLCSSKVQGVRKYLKYRAFTMFLSKCVIMFGDLVKLATALVRHGG